jgi:SOS response regulatory protein OraA/RecX
MQVSKDIPFYEKPDLIAIKEIRDLRAAVLAFGLVNKVNTFQWFSRDTIYLMFSRLCEIDNKDKYLKSAIYLMSGEASELCDSVFTDTAELLVALSVFPNIEEALKFLWPQLDSLLGKDRTISVCDNVDLFVWISTALSKVKQKYRKTPLIKAFASINRSSDALLNMGYTSLEIAYITVKVNVRSDKARTASYYKSVNTLLKEILSSTELPPENVLDDMSKLSSGISMYGLSEDSSIAIVCPEVYLWFNNIINKSSVDGLLAVEPTSESFINGLNDSDYCQLMCTWILKHRNESKEYLENCVHSKKSFLDTLLSSYRFNRVAVINTLVESGILDIADCREYIRDIAKDVRSKKVFEYCKEHGLVDTSRYWGREFLSDEENKELFRMYDDFIFYKRTGYYIQSVSDFLKDPIARRLVPYNERRKLYRAIKFIEDAELDRIYLGAKAIITRDVKTLNEEYVESLSELLSEYGADVTFETKMLNWTELKNILNKFEEVTDDADNA